MKSEPFRLRRDDGVELYVHRFEPDARPVRAVVQLVHGMGEHGARYERLARALADDGIAVFAADQRGHGRSAPSPADLGHFADRDGWSKVVEDQRALGLRIGELHGERPRALVGHSMGSFVALECLTRFGDAYRAAVLSGSSGSAGPRAWMFRALATVERLRLGVRGHSQVLQRGVFGQFNVPFEPAATPFDWLSRDPAEVAKYVADPLCGFVVTAGSLAELATALQGLYRRDHLARIPHALPLLAIAGERDPVGGRAGVEKLVAELRAAGLTRVDLRLYPDARHELLNETNRDEVTADLRSWLRGALGIGESP